MKTGLVMEGGAMRGMFTAGVLDVIMEHDITFDGAIGVSAGAVFGCNLKSHQIGRAIRYNKKYCRDPRYVGFRSWLKTGDLYNAEFDYEELPTVLDPFDTQAYQACPMAFYVVATDANTGKPVYHRCDLGVGEDAQWMRASASMPGVSNMVRLDGMELSDGGTADSVPLRYFQSIGYDRNVVILTQPKGYRKGKNKTLPLLKFSLRHYPRLIDALARRPSVYNQTMDELDALEEQGSILVIRPPEPLNINRVERDPAELERVYQIGRITGVQHVDAMRRFLAQGPK